MLSKAWLMAQPPTRRRSLGHNQVMKVNTLAELKVLKRAMAEQAAREAAQRELERLAALRREREHKLFELAVGPVLPLPRAGGRIEPHRTPVEPIPVQRHKDEAAVMREALSDEFDVETLLHTDEQLSFRRPGIPPEVVRKLREGSWSIQRQIDLHGLRTDEAREALGRFVREAHQAGLRCVRVVHGKGLGSPGRMPVLKARVLRWLVQKNEVMAFVQARPAEGGAGALVVLLRSG